MVRPVRLAVALLTLLAAGPAAAAVALGDTPSTSLAPGLAFRLDPQGLLTPELALEEARAGQFTPVGDRPGALARTASVVWLHATLQADGAGTWAMVLEPGLVEVVDAWWWGAGAAGHRRGGLAVPVPARTIELDAAGHQFPLVLGTGERLNLLLRVESSRPPILGLTAWTRDGLQAHATALAGRTAAEFSLLAVVVALSLATWALLRDRWSLRFVGVMTTFTAYQLAVGGIGPAWLWPGSPRWALLAPPFFALLTGTFAVSYSRAFVDAPRRHPRLDRLARALWWWLAASTCAVALAPWVGLQHLSFHVSFVPSTLAFPMVVALGVAEVRSGDAPARFFLASWVVVAALGLLYAGAVGGLLPATSLAVHGLHLGVVAGALILFLSLAARVQAERRAAQARLEQLVTERTARLSESEERFRIAFLTSPEAISITRLADGRYLMVNDGFAQITGWPAEALVGRTALEVNIWRDPADRARLVEGLRRQGRVDNLEATFVGRDGREVQGLMSAQRITLGGEEYLLAVTRDVTARRQAEAERDRLSARLQQAQKLEAIGRLAGGVAHDFNNLLTAVTTNAQLSLLDLPPGDPSRPAFEEIRDAAGRATALTRQLLAFSRRQVLAPRALDLGAHVAGMAVMLRRLLGEDIELRLDLEGGTPAVLADPGQVEQVVVNLAVNARDAMPQGGRITVSLQAAEVGEDAGGERRPGRYGVLVVEDDGEGIPADVLPHVFEPFFTTKAGKGTGLGLSTVYGVASQHGGFVEVDSAPGRGTRFRVAFPAAAGQAARAEPKGVPALVGGSETVLLAEDEPSVREATRQVLVRLGYRVLVATDGVEAEEVAAREPGRIDLLLTDVVMPRRNGRDLAARLRALRPGLQVVFMSGYTQEAVDRAGVLEPGVRLVQKPYEVARLAATLREALGGGPAAPA